VIAACRGCMGDPMAPLFVGGGIRSPEAAAEARTAGADFVVIGTALEREGGHSLVAFVRAVRDGHA